MFGKRLTEVAVVDTYRSDVRNVRTEEREVAGVAGRDARVWLTASIEGLDVRQD